MPVYEYRCKDCHRTHEIEHGFSDERPTKCPTCGGTLARVFHPVGVVFKGSGFHKTDYSGAKTSKSAASDKAASEPKSEGKGEAKESSSKPAPDSTSSSEKKTKSS